MATRETLHRLIDELPDDTVGAVELFLEFVLARRGRSDAADPVIRAFMNAPEDDEPLTADDLAAVEEARSEFERGDTIPWETYLAGPRIGS